MDNLPEENPILYKAIQAYEDGKPVPVILDEFKEHRLELEEIFAAIALLEKEQRSILPSPLLLEKILAKIPTAGQASLKTLSPNNFFGQINKFILSHFRILVPAGLAIAVAGLIIIKPVSNHYQTTVAAVNAEQITDNAVQDSSFEQTLTADWETDAQYLPAGNEIANNFNKIINTNEF